MGVLAHNFIKDDFKNTGNKLDLWEAYLGSKYQDFDGLDEERAGQLIMTARAPWFEEDSADEA